MKFKITDNYGKIYYKEYEWTEENGIPNAEDILESMEECTCNLNESMASCEGDCIMFDEGTVEVVKEDTE